MESEDWKDAVEAVFRSVGEWGSEILGPDYALVKTGPYGPYCLLSDCSGFTGYLDSAYPFFSGLDVTLDSHTIACLL